MNMDKQIVNEWMEFPISVFVDSQVFIHESYDFGAKGKFAFLVKHINTDKVKLLTSAIVKGEVERHIRDDVTKGIDKLQSALNDRRLAIFRGGKHKGLFQILASSSMIEEAKAIFNEYLSSAKAIFLDINSIDLSAVMSDYFCGEPPFGDAHKKSEFPDAFNASMLQQYANKNGRVYIVSGDGDFSNIANVFCFKTLGELLDAINSQDEICSRAKEYLAEASVRQRIYDKVETELLDKGYELAVDGTDTDRKGVSSGYEYDEIELLSVSPIALTDVEVIDVDYDDKFITVAAECKTKLEFSCSFFDEENSIWDSEDKEFASSYYGTMHEIHNATIPIKFTMSFEDIKFNLEEIDVNTNIELNQYTLQKDGRNRTDDPYSYWDDNTMIVNNPCPDCGCEITFENDGGNGFCFNCAPNH